MSVIRNVIISFILLITLLSFGCQKNNTNIVARIGDEYSYTFDELRKYVLDWLYNKKFRDQTVAYNNALNDMVTNQLKRIDFFEKGLQNNQELVKNIMRNINEELVIEYFQTQFLEKYVNDASVEATYKRMNKEVTYRQIILYKPENASPDVLNSLREQLNSIRKEAEVGKDFSQLVELYSQDVNAAITKGFKSPANWENSITNPVDDIAFGLNVGEIRSIETKDALYVIQVTQISEVTTNTLEEEKDNIKTKLSDIYVERSLEEFENFKKSILVEEEIVWNQKALNQIVTWSGIPGFFTNKYQEIIKKEIEENRNQSILTYDKTNIDYREFLYLLDNILTIKTLGQYKLKDIQDFLIEAVRTNIIAKKARDLELEKNIFHANTKNPVLRSRIVGLYNLAVIESKIPERTEKTLREFYEDQKDSTFYQLEKVNIYTLIADDKEKIESYKKRLDEGIPFEKLEDRILVRTFIRDRDGVIKSFLSKEKPYLGEAAMRLNLNEVAAPVEYYDYEKSIKQYAIIKCVGKVEEKQLTYDDVQNKIEEIFIEHYRTQIEKDIREELHKKYPVEFYYDVVKENLSFLGNK